MSARILIAIVLGLVLAPAAALAGDSDGPRLGVSVRVDERGLRVVEVIDGTPAEDAGIEPGDLLLTAGARRLRSVDDLRDAIARPRMVVLTLERDGERHRVAVPLGEGDAPSPASSQRRGGDHGRLLPDLFSGFREQPGDDAPAADRGDREPGGELLPDLGAFAPLLEGLTDTLDDLIRELERAVPELRDARGLIGFEAFVIDADGRPVAVRGIVGEIVGRDGDRLVVRPNETDIEHTFRLTPETLVLRGLGEGEARDLAEGERVFVLAAGERDEVRVAVIIGRGGVLGGIGGLLPFLGGIDGFGALVPFLDGTDGPGELLPRGESRGR